MAVVLSSPQHEPIERLRTMLNEKLGYSRCAICTTLFLSGERPGQFQYVVRQVSNSPKALSKAVAQEKGLMYWLYGSAYSTGGHNSDASVYRRRYVCPDCVAALFAHLQPEE